MRLSLRCTQFYTRCSVVCYSAVLRVCYYVLYKQYSITIACCKAKRFV